MVWLISLRQAEEVTPFAALSVESNWRGRVLAGGEAQPLLDFDEGDYQVVRATNRPVFLFFYADWSPLCRTEAERFLYPAFNNLIGEPGDLVGFRVHYADRATTPVGRGLAQEFKVATACAKLILSPAGDPLVNDAAAWDEARYAFELAAASRLK